MLHNAQVIAMVPCVDLDRARDFYGKTLGLNEMDFGPSSADEEAGMIAYLCGNGSIISVYQRPTPTMADHTAAAFIVEDFDAAVDDLISRGIKFEVYDLPDIEFDDRGVATMGDLTTAWFKDPEGNIFSVSEMPEM